MGLFVVAVGGGASAQTGQRPVDKVQVFEGPAPQTTDKIVGGIPAEPGRFPFQVALIAVNTPVDREHLGQFCGGALIAPRWVLTAAHCVPNTQAKEIDVYVGSTILPSGGSTGNGAKGVRLHVAEVLSHTSYNDATHDNDIALLKLAQAAPDQFRPAGIATAEIEADKGANGKKVTVIGWGALTEGGGTTPRLMEVDVTVQDRGTCEANYRAVVPSSRITENMFCAGEPAGGKDSCQGDSGGFIGVPVGDGKWAQLGVVSWGIGCARPQLFGVYTRASKYQDWVKQTMQNFN